ncbi:MAG: glycerophosphodiester phosphodiesterase family protein, partial [Paludibacteraceae bacterium]|nr:glycerophosphodiester phosphodiesterase family protein [Paludibacteraceae bacterium]
MQLKKRILEYLRLPLIHVVAELIRLRRTTSVLLLHNLAKGPYRGAHKGAWGLPENTYESVKAAYEQGYPIVEVDIAETADNVIVLLHDDTIDRTSNGSGKVLEMTYQQLSAFDFSGTDIVEDLYGGGENQCVTIPTLA